MFTAQTGDGIDNVTITDVAANSVINTEGGNDVIALNINGGNDIDVFAGAGVDQITIANGANGALMVERTPTRSFSRTTLTTLTMG